MSRVRAGRTILVVCALCLANTQLFVAVVQAAESPKETAATWIAFVSTRGGRPNPLSHVVFGSFGVGGVGPSEDVYAIRPDGSGERLVSDEPYPHRDWTGRWVPGKPALAWVDAEGLMLTDLQQGTTLPIIPFEPRQDVIFHQQDVMDCAWAPGGDRLAVIFQVPWGPPRRTLHIYDLSGKMLATWAGPQGHMGEFDSVDWSLTGTLAVSLNAEIWTTTDPRSPDRWHRLVSFWGAPGGPISIAGRSLRWSPDGRGLLFVGSVPGGENKVWLLRADGRELRPLRANGTLPESSASWSPGGDMVAYIGTERSSGQVRKHVYVSARDGSATRDYTPSECTGAEWPTWSPDGRQLAFAGQLEGKWRLYVADVVSGEAKWLTNGPGDDTYPMWGGSP
jgi:hypothetical protein